MRPSPNTFRQAYQPESVPQPQQPIIDPLVTLKSDYKQNKIKKNYGMSFGEYVNYRMSAEQMNIYIESINDLILTLTEPQDEAKGEKKQK